MDFLDPKKRKSHRRRLYLGYLLMGIALILATRLLVLVSYGFDYDRQSGQVIQKGLVFIDAQPEPMDIYLNEGLINDRTSARLLLPSSKYKLQLKRTGYRDWQKSFELEGGSVERFAYPRLFPEDIQTRVIGEPLASSVSVFTASPDRRRGVMSLAAQPFIFTSFNLVDPTDPVVPLVLPDAIITDKEAGGTVRIVEWSNNNRHVLLDRVYPGGREYYLLDREDAALSVNISKTLNTTADDIRLQDKKQDKFFLFTTATGTIQTADLGSRIVSPAILSNVLQYKSHGDDILAYVQTIPDDPAKVKVGVLIDGKDDFQLHQYPAGGTYVMDVARFDGRWYYVTASSSDKRALIFIDPIEQLRSDPSTKFASPDTFLPIDSVQFGSFSANARFIGLQSGRKMAIYDSELQKKHFFELDEGMPANYEVEWMDGHRVSYVANNQVVVVEFDGSNRQALTASTNGLLPLYDTEYEALYGVVPNATAGQYNVQRSELVVLQ